MTPDRISRTARILVVDDEPANVTLLRAVLTSAGYTALRCCTDPREAVRLHQEDRFDLILLDIRMPGMDGFMVMETLAPLHKDDFLPVIVLTAHDDRETRRRALSLGARDFVTKPFSMDEVLLRVRNQLEVRALHQSLEERVRARTQDLMLAQHEVLRRLGRAGEYRDNETGAHVMRMAHSCRLLALAAGLGQTHAENIFQASQMHDIGKIGVPDSVLLKPGRLSGDEWEIMKRHVAISGEILAEPTSELLKLARVIALTHHERYDGSGYPEGLVGDAIPIEGRIATICDIFDALTSVRPYKAAWSAPDAMAFLREHAGDMLDPTLVALFEQILPQVLALRELFSD
ncbi:HD domain-containing phosphohydrolase [Roseospira visakhapatnamensis]|uniref:Putative two-component system response regulator n=1 Tax=Roseospira visakhapatnamensis TaxID=390880 RepID=A0A7W6REM7_9PROT|nr:HD domain-containing phosphohydrolase [Roseospira visakhapatnamensis]MBB4266907.1 putative two-component system response regulator [Roseospira visakhapatnamensis]